MLNRGRRSQSLLLASLLTLAMMAVAGFATTAGAAALRQPYAQAGATGTGVNSPPVNSEPLIPGKRWDAKNYRIPHHEAACPQPPQSTAARMALDNSPVTLDYYGLPRPSIYNGDRTKWQSAVATMTHHWCDSTIPVINGQPVMNYGFSRNNIWGGWGNNNCINNCFAYHAAQFQFYVPNIQLTNDYTSDSIWVGVGGANNNNALSQDGVSQFSELRAWSFNAFYESLACGVNIYEQDLFPVKLSDLMYFYTDVNGFDVLDDQTTGNYQTKSWGCGATDSAEFIIERNGQNNTAPLANYGTEYAYNAQYEDAANSWWGVDENSRGYGNGFYSWGLYGFGGCNCYLETQSTPSTTNHASTWYWTWRNWQ